MLATTQSATLLGIEGHPVSVEVHVGPGLPGFTVVGLPDTSCREARDRVRAAILSSNLEWPNRRITVNLAPSGLRKGGAGLDLAIAVGLLLAVGQIDALAEHGGPVAPGPAMGPADDRASAETVEGDRAADPPESNDLGLVTGRAAEAVAATGFLGELGLDGSIRPVPGVLPLVDALPGRSAVVPVESADEARLVGRHVVRPVSTLTEVVSGLAGIAPWPEAPPCSVVEPADPLPDLADVAGQPVARQALEVAAAGGHHLLMVGPPGSGKTMLAQRLPGLLPVLAREVALAATRIHSAAGERLPADGLVTQPPLRAPHHTATPVALVGGGTAWLRPGEISLAHGGVLFLDEMGEFPPAALDGLRQPLEEGVIRVTRAAASVTFPARFLLVGAMNPCPCGGGQSPGGCRCSDAARARYARRISGPILDRFDLRVDVLRPDGRQLLDRPKGEPTAMVRERVLAVRARSAERGVSVNARLTTDQLDEYAPLGRDARALLRNEVDRGRLSARGLQRVRCVARTVSDLRQGPAVIEPDDVLTALGLRTTPVCFDREPVLL